MIPVYLQRHSLTVFVILLVSASITLAQDNPPKNGLTAIKVETFAKDFPANDSITLMPNGDLIVADAGPFVGGKLTGKSAYRVEKGGEVKLLTDQLNAPVGTALGPDKKIYIADSYNQAIKIIGSDGNLTSFAESIPGGGGLAFDSKGQLFYPNWMNHTVQQLDRQGKVTTYLKGKPLNGPVGIVMRPSGGMYVGNLNDGRIITVDATGKMTVAATIPGMAGFAAGHLAMLGDTLLISGLAAHRIFALPPDGALQVFAGSGKPGHLDGPALEAQFNVPNGLAVDHKAGIVWVTEAGQKTLRKIHFKP